MSRAEGLKMSMEMIMDIENNKKYTLEEKRYWTNRILLGDIAASLAAIADNTSPKAIADNTSKEEETKACVDCKYYMCSHTEYPCCQCDITRDMWEAKE